MKLRGRFNSRKAKSMSERGRRMAKARWAADRARRDAEMPALIRAREIIEIENLPRREHDPAGSLQWTDFRTGRVIRWTVLLGARAGTFRLRTPDGRTHRTARGWSWLLDHLRPILARTRHPSGIHSSSSLKTEN